MPPHRQQGNQPPFGAAPSKLTLHRQMIALR